eukprot:3339354-Rhodomonas_salina.2
MSAQTPTSQLARGPTRFLQASVQIGLFLLWRDIFPARPDARLSIRTLLRDLDTRPKEEMHYRPMMLWEARVLAGDTRVLAHDTRSNALHSLYYCNGTK